MQLAFIIAVFIAIAGVLFALQNSTPVAVVFLIWRFDGSLAIVVLLAIALGAIVVALISAPATLRRKWSVGRLERELEALKTDNAQLRRQVAERANGAGGDTSASAAPGPGAPPGLAAMAPRFPPPGGDAKS